MTHQEETFIDIKPGQSVRLKNTHCAYCNAELQKYTATKDHVIGTKFVPKGKSGSQMNLICNACERCNNFKSDLEDDISAITLTCGPSGWPPGTDQTVIDEAQRKAEGAFSRHAKKNVANSRVETEISAALGQETRVKFGLVAGPQLDQRRVFELAHYHLMGFFHWITYQREIKRGWYWPGEYMPWKYTRREDWGNSLFVGFANAVADWEPRVLLNTAEGYFQTAIRRHPDADCWSWALEWNRTTRIIGFLGDRSAAQEVVQEIPPLKFEIEYFDGEATNRIRQQRAITAKEDKMFEWPEDLDESMGSFQIKPNKRD